MRKFLYYCLAFTVIVAFGVGSLLWSSRGLSAREEPTDLEAFVAQRLRLLAMPRSARTTRNPVELTNEALAEGRAHFADHCAICHANDGSGETPIGRNLYPKAPDMRAERTQSLTDGELFYVIHNGIRFTGMPAWGADDPSKDHDSWELVHFIRHLPNLTAAELAEMEQLNPTNRHEKKTPKHGHANHHH